MTPTTTSRSVRRVAALVALIGVLAAPSMWVGGCAVDNSAGCRCVVATPAPVVAPVVVPRGQLASAGMLSEPCAECKNTATAALTAALNAAWATYLQGVSDCNDQGNPPGCLDAVSATYVAAVNTAYVTYALAMAKCPCD